MSDPYDSTASGTIDDCNRAVLPSKFSRQSAKQRSFYSAGTWQAVRIRHLSEKEDIELVDALRENTCAAYLGLKTEEYTKSSAEAMAKYVRTREIYMQNCGSVKKCCVILCLHFKKARRSRNYTTL
jgi:hypothetical protein